MAAAEAFRVPGQAQKFSLARESFRKKREFCGKRGAAYPLPLYGAKAEPSKSRAAAQEEGEEQRTKQRNRREMLWNGQYITVEAVKAGQATVRCKSKTRVILIPAGLRKIMLKYIRQSGRQGGAVFVTKSGKPLNRRNIWRSMKELCQRAGVEAAKVFPHNLRHLFARTFYSVEKDIVRLADMLGHSSINTTRIYTAESKARHRAGLKKTVSFLFAT